MSHLPVWLPIADCIDQPYQLSTHCMVAGLFGITPYNAVMRYGNIAIAYHWSFGPQLSPYIYISISISISIYISDAIARLNPDHWTMCLIDDPRLIALIAITLPINPPLIDSTCHHRLRYVDQIWTVDQRDSTAPVQSCSASDRLCFGHFSCFSLPIV